MLLGYAIADFLLLLLYKNEKDEIQLKIDFVGKLIEAREQKGITQSDYHVYS